MREPARVGLVGYGLGGSVFHAPLISTTPGLALAAVVTSDPERAGEVRRRYPQARVAASFDGLLDDPAGLDLVVVTVPNAWHLEVAERAVAAGLPVVLDKPVTPSLAEAERLGRAAAAAGVSVIPYHNRRWDGDFLTVRRLIRAGRLGRVWRFESRFERWKPVLAARSWKQDPDLPGGGVLLDLGTHLVDQALVLFGTPVSVYAEVRSRRGALDDDAFVALGYADGTVSHLWASSQTAAGGPRFRVLGSQAGYVKFGMDPQEGALRAGRLPGLPGWGEEPEASWGRLGTPERSEPVRTEAGSYPVFYAGVAEHLHDGAAVPVPFTDALAGLAVLEAAVRSARSGTVEAPEPSRGP